MDEATASWSSCHLPTQFPAWPQLATKPSIWVPSELPGWDGGEDQRGRQTRCLESRFWREVLMICLQYMWWNTDSNHFHPAFLWRWIHLNCLDVLLQICPLANHVAPGGRFSISCECWMWSLCGEHVSWRIASASKNWGDTSSVPWQRFNFKAEVVAVATWWLWLMFYFLRQASIF